MNLLTVQEAALRLGVTTKTIYNWIDKGTLKACRIGGHSVRIEELELLKVIGNYLYIG